MKNPEGRTQIGQNHTQYNFPYSLGFPDRFRLSSRWENLLSRQRVDLEDRETYSSEGFWSVNSLADQELKSD